LQTRSCRSIGVSRSRSAAEHITGTRVVPSTNKVREATPLSPTVWAGFEALLSQKAELRRLKTVCSIIFLTGFNPRAHAGPRLLFPQIFPPSRISLVSKPIRLFGFLGGSSKAWIASKTTLNWASYFFSNS